LKQGHSTYVSRASMVYLLNQRINLRMGRIAAYKLDPVMKPATYVCGHRGCDHRFLLGIRNSGHIKHAESTIKSQGWVFHNKTQTFLCPNHRHLARAIDVERTTTGRALPSDETRIDCWVYREAWYRDLMRAHPPQTHSQPGVQPTNRTTP
jgi:hypothetical protein